MAKIVFARGYSDSLLIFKINCVHKMLPLYFAKANSIYPIDVPANIRENPNTRALKKELKAHLTSCKCQK